LFFPDESPDFHEDKKRERCALSFSFWLRCDLGGLTLMRWTAVDGQGRLRVLSPLLPAILLGIHQHGGGYRQWLQLAHLPEPQVRQ